MKQSVYNISYIHPRDMDPSQPVIKSLSALRKFKSYCGLKTAEKKFKKMLYRIAGFEEINRTFEEFH